MFYVTISHIDTTARKASAKRFDVITTVVSKPSKKTAWKLCLDTAAKAAASPNVALVNIVVSDESQNELWSLR